MRARPEGILNLEKLLYYDKDEILVKIMKSIRVKRNQRKSEEFLLFRYGKLNLHTLEKIGP